MTCRAVLFALTPEQEKQLLEAKGDDAVTEFVDFIEEEWDEQGVCELDKSWDAIHRMLTDGKLEWDNGEYPLNHAILGGRQLYEGDDYIVTFVAPEQVADVAAVLPKLTEAELRERFFKIDPDDYGEPIDEDGFVYPMSWWENLVMFYGEAASAGRSVVFTVDM